MSLFLIIWFCRNVTVTPITSLTGDTHDSRLPTHSEIEGDPDAADRPAYMVYMVDPFSYASDADDLRRLAMLGLLRCFNEMLKTLPNHVHENIHLQVGVNISFTVLPELYPQIIIKAYVWSTLLYGCETWTITTKNMTQFFFEMWAYRKMAKISCREKKTSV